MNNSINTFLNQKNCFIDKMWWYDQPWVFLNNQYEFDAVNYLNIKPNNMFYPNNMSYVELYKVMYLPFVYKHYFIILHSKNNLDNK